jgi:hypothetical protein
MVRRPEPMPDFLTDSTDTIVSASPAKCNITVPALRSLNSLQAHENGVSCKLSTLITPQSAIPFAGGNETFVADAASVGVDASCVGHRAQTSHCRPCGV